MPQLATQPATIYPKPARAPRFNRRRVHAAVTSSMICLVLFRHDELRGQVRVSDSDDEGKAVWLRKAQILIDRVDRGRFLVVTLRRQLAQDLKLYYAILDWSRYQGEELAQLKSAVEAMKARRQQVTYGGRTAPLHPNATA